MTAPQSKKFGRFSGLAKSLLQLLGVLVWILIAIAVYYWWDASKNRGRESGYWGEYNRVSNALASLPEVKIKSGSYNDDISLEAFQFDLETGGRSISLFFTEGDAIRKMQRAQMIEALRKRLADALIPLPPIHQGLTPVKSSVPAKKN